VKYTIDSFKEVKAKLESGFYPDEIADFKN